MGSRLLTRLATRSFTGATILHMGAGGALHICPSLRLEQAHRRVLCLCDCIPGYVLTALRLLCRLANSSLSKCLEIYLHSCGPHLEVDARNKAGLTAAEVAAASGNDVCLDLVRRYKSHALFAQPPAPAPAQVGELPRSCAWGPGAALHVAAKITILLLPCRGSTDMAVGRAKDSCGCRNGCSGRSKIPFSAPPSAPAWRLFRGPWRARPACRCLRCRARRRGTAPRRPSATSSRRPRPPSGPPHRRSASSPLKPR